MELIVFGPTTEHEDDEDNNFIDDDDTSGCVFRRVGVVGVSEGAMRMRKCPLVLP